MGNLLGSARVLAMPLANPHTSDHLGPQLQFDGEGVVTLEPNDDLVVRNHYTLRVKFVIGPHGMQQGGAFRFVIPRGLPLNDWWSPPQVSNRLQAGYSTLRWSSAQPARLIIREIYRGIHIVLDSGALQVGDVIELTYGDTRGGGPGARVQRTAADNISFHVASDTSGNGKFGLLERLPTVNTVAGAPVEAAVVVPSQVVVGRPFAIRLAVLDFYKNAATDFAGTIRLNSVSTAGERLSIALKVPSTISLTAADAGLIELTGVVGQAGPWRLRAELESSASAGTPGSGPADQIIAVSNPALALATAPDLRLWWGDIHGHTDRSDGGGTPQDYYRYARDVAGLDFSALTDHDDLLDDLEWAESKRVTNTFNAPGRFTTFVAYEWTSWRYGHRNVYYRADDGPIFRHTETATQTPDALWKALRSTGLELMTVAHHTRGLPGTYDGGHAEIDWRRFVTDAGMEPMVEVYSIHGHSESRALLDREYANSLSIRETFADRHGYVEEALRLGWRLGLMCSGDDHSGHPGYGPGAHGEPAGLIGVYALENTRHAIWEAMKARRVYGTTGERIVVEFKADDHWMGEAYVSSQAPHLTARVVGTASIDRLELVRDMVTILTVSGAGSNLASLDVRDEAFSTGTHFYFVRVTQVDQAMAWSSPLWITHAG